jgi:hypothetical protein
MNAKCVQSQQKTHPIKLSTQDQQQISHDTFCEQYEEIGLDALKTAKKAKEVHLKQVQIAEQETALKLKAKELKLELKRKQYDLKVKEMECKVEVKNKERTLAFLMKGMNACTQASADNVLDERTKLLFKDRISNISLGDLSDPTTSARTPITISNIASELGMLFDKADYCLIGKEVKRRYVGKHGKNPSKHSQIVDGAVRMVNSYLGEDREMIVEVIKEYHDRKTNPEKFIKRRKLQPCKYD